MCIRVTSLFATTKTDVVPAKKNSWLSGNLHNLQFSKTMHLRKFQQFLFHELDVQECQRFTIHAIVSYEPLCTADPRFYFPFKILELELEQATLYTTSR